MKAKKFQIDVSTAKQLDKLRRDNGWSAKQLYLYYKGQDVNNLDIVENELLDFDAFRKHIERKANRPQPEEIIGGVLEPNKLFNDLDIEFKLSEDEFKEIKGFVVIPEEEFTANLSSYDDVAKLLFSTFKLPQEEFEIVSYKPSYSQKGKNFKIQATFKRRAKSVYDESAVIARYTKTLEKIGTYDVPEVVEIDRDNLLVINLVDVHWNKLPFLGFDSDYFEKFEEMIYDRIRYLLHLSRATPIARVVITIGHDFFQTNDGRGTTKKGTPVSHVLEYEDMYDIGVRILANCVAIASKNHVVDAYYVLANHDADVSWHASREIKLMFSKSPSVNVIADKLPFHYIEWGSSLIELVHENLKSGSPSTKMHVTAREAWGRTKYHYSIGGHLHGEFMTREKDGVTSMGSRALSDTDKWHYLEGYLSNIRGLQGYVFNKNEGLIATYSANL